MAENAIVRILNALLKHQVKKLVGEQALGAIGEEIAALGSDQLDSWLNAQVTPEELERVANYAQECFHEKVENIELEQWMISLPLGNLPKVVEALEELPTSSDESKLASVLRESVTANWRGIPPSQVETAVNSFLSCLRSALLPLEKQTLMVIGRSVLRTEDKIDRLLNVVGIYLGKVEKDQLLAESYISGDTGGKRLKVFLCHSSADNKIVREIYLRLQKEGISPWLDEEDILPGENWRKAIQRAIQSSDAVLACLSISSINEAGHVQKEISMSLDVADEQPENSIFVIPLRLEECIVPDRLSQIQYVDYFKADGFQKLMKALQIRLEQLVAHLY